LKIVFLVTRSDNIGGSHIHIRDLGTQLLKDGHEVTVFIGGDGPIIDYYKNFGLNTINIPNLKRNISPINDLKSFFEIKKKLKDFSPDIVSTHSSKAGFIGRLASRALSIPVIFTAHGWSFTTGKSTISRVIYKFLEKIITPFTDFVITVSDYDRNLAIKHLNINLNKIKTIYNGMRDIDPSFYANPAKQGKVNIVKVARFDQQKNHRDLLRAASGLRNIELHFIGDGPLLNEVKKFAKSLGMFDNVKFYGRVENVHEILSKCQIFTLISNWEGFPRSTVEAMRAGLPVIVTNVGGAAEAVSHNVNGYIIEKNDQRKLKYYLKILVEDNEKRSKMGKASRSIYNDKLQFEMMYKKTVEIYQKILNLQYDTSKK
jgi:glycosyltransferase involved in cell wall biosynthesis